jgi:ubiquitin
VRDAPAAKTGEQKIRVSWGVLRGVVESVADINVSDDTKKVLSQAKQLSLGVSINKQGEVQCYQLRSATLDKLLDADSVLIKSEIDQAIKDWKFKPYLLNGVPIQLESSIPLELHKNVLKVAKSF